MMIQGASLTAQAAALVRARDTRRTPAHRLVDDPFAARFLEHGRSWFTVLGGVGGVVARAVDLALRLPILGPAGMVLARHRIIDDHLRAEALAGASQCVILGAGLDARAYRFPPPVGPATYFEVDHPAQIERKRFLVAATLGAPAPHVRYCGVDFGREPLSDRLLDQGFDPARRTVFIWEGVTYYLAGEAVRATLAMVRQLSAPGSTIVLDAWTRVAGGRGVLDAMARGPLRAMTAAVSEPMSFFLEGEDGADRLLSEAGFRPLFVFDGDALTAELRTRRRLLAVPAYMRLAAASA
jgi:methyltransferase (TIGR00027 family)